MSHDLTGAPTVPPLRGKGLVITGAVLLVLSLVGVVAGAVGIATTASGLLGEIGTATATPATITQQLKAGGLYAVYEAVPGATGSTGGDGPLDLQVVASDVTVTAPDGSSVAVTDTGDSVNTVGSNDQLFAEVATFEARDAGTYTVTVATQGTLVAVAPALSAIGRAASWAVVVGVSALAGLVGLVLLIVGIVVRSGSRRAQRAALAAAAAPGYAVPGYAAPSYGAAPSAPPAGATPSYPTVVEPVPAPAPMPAALPAAGWYADPERPGGQRWWDGTAWTEHRA